MTYKFKSLIYFSCFVLASLGYYLVEQHDEFQKQLQSKSYVEADLHSADEIDQPQDELEEEIP